MLSELGLGSAGTTMASLLQILQISQLEKRVNGTCKAMVIKGLHNRLALCYYIVYLLIHHCQELFLHLGNCLHWENTSFLSILVCAEERGCVCVYLERARRSAIAV